MKKIRKICLKLMFVIIVAIILLCVLEITTPETLTCVAKQSSPDMITFY